jgi:hypothetical protein
VGERVQFRGVVEPFRAGATGGLLVVAIPAEAATALGGLKQMRVRGTVNGAEVASSTMPRGGGVLALSLSRAILKTAGAAAGDEIDVELDRAP